MSNLEIALKTLESMRGKGAPSSIDLHLLPEIKLSDADALSTRAWQINAGGEFSEPANIFYTLYTISGKSSEKFDFGICCVRVLTNAANLDQAEALLNEIEGLSSEMNGRSRTRTLSSLFERRAWIADARGDYKKEIKFLEKAKDFGNGIPERERMDEDIARFLTIEHFLGRAYFKSGDLKNAMRMFESNLEGYEILDDIHAMAYNCEWLARVNLAIGNILVAETYVMMAVKLFDRYAKEVGSPFPNGHSFRIQSELAQANGDGETAIRFAFEEIRVTFPQGIYSEGIWSGIENIIRAVGIPNTSK